MSTITPVIVDLHDGVADLADYLEAHDASPEAAQLLRSAASRFRGVLEGVDEGHDDPIPEGEDIGDDPVPNEDDPDSELLRAAIAERGDRPIRSYTPLED